MIVTIGNNRQQTKTVVNRKAKASVQSNLVTLFDWLKTSRRFLQKSNWSSTNRPMLVQKIDYAI